MHFFFVETNHETQYGAFDSLTCKQRYNLISKKRIKIIFVRCLMQCHYSKRHIHVVLRNLMGLIIILPV